MPQKQHKALLGVADRDAQFVVFMVLIKRLETKTRHPFVISDILTALAT